MSATKKMVFSVADIAVLYDDMIEDMLASLEGMELDPRDALDVSEIVGALNVERKNHGRELVALPPALHLQINEYAGKGMYKGKGRRFPRRDSLLKKRFLDTKVEMARERKETLSKSGTVRNKLDASLQAAEEIAAEVRAHGLKRSDETIRREMSKRR
jgi:hypothetical protein